MKQPKYQHAILAAGVVAASTALQGTGFCQTSDPALNALVKKGILTEQEAKQALADTEAQKQAAAPTTTTNASPFVFTAGKEFKMKLGGFIQGQAEFGNVAAWEGNFSDTSKQVHDRFRLRRARLNVTGEFLERFDYKMEGDFQTSDGLTPNTRTEFGATDIFINYNQVPEANLKFGQYKAPFGLEQLTPDTTLYLAERSQVTEALTPERQIGVQVWGQPLARVLEDHKDILDYSFGMFNGNGRNVTINDDGNFMYAGRVNVTPITGTLWDQPVKWRIGGDGMYSRYAAGTRISPTGTLLEAADGSLSSFTPASPAKSLGWGVDQTLTIGPVDLIAEYLEQKISPQSTGFNQFVANGYYVQASYFFPKHCFQLVGRYDSFNPGQKADDDLRSVTGGFNWYIKGDNIKLMFDYIHTWSEFRDNHAGLGKNQFDMGLVRLQLMF